jgi:hypothetical protein
LTKSIIQVIQHHIQGFIAAWVVDMRLYRRQKSHFRLKTTTSTHLRKEEFTGRWSYTRIISRNSKVSLTVIPCSQFKGPGIEWVVVFGKNFFKENEP